MRIARRFVATAALLLPVLPLLPACEPLVVIDDGDGNEGEGEGGAAEGEGEDCDDDRDGIDCGFDCDDADPDAGSNADDVDCDGVPSFRDCNDFDDTVAIASDDDEDCDGVATDDDCDDEDGSVGDRAADADCDGTATADDCDDQDPGSTDRFNDADCDDIDGFNDCDDRDPEVGANFGDNDCDGVPSGADCDDFNRDVGENDDDSDCDGFDNATELACSSDPDSFFVVPGDLDGDDVCDENDADADGDGVGPPADCDDFAAAVRPGADEVDLDGVDNNCDGDFGRDVTPLPALTTGGEYRSFATTGARHFAARPGNIDVFDGPISAPARSGDIDIDNANALAVIGSRLYVLDADNATFTNRLHVIDTNTLAIVQTSTLAVNGLRVSGGRLLDGACSRLFELDGNGLVTGTRELVEAGAQSCAVVGTGLGERVVALIGNDLVLIDGASQASAPVALEPTTGFDRRVVVDGDVAYVVSDGSVAAYDVSGDVSGGVGVLLDVLTEEQSVVIGGDAGIVVDDTLVVIGGNTTLFLDIADPRALVVTGTQPFVSAPHVVVGSSLFYVGGGAVARSVVTESAVSESVAVPTIVSRAVSMLYLDNSVVYLGVDDAFDTAIQARTEATLGGVFQPPRNSVFTGLRQPRSLDQTTTPIFDSVFDTAALVEFDGDDSPASVQTLRGAFGNLIGANVNDAGTTAVTVVTFIDDTTIATWDVSGASPVFQGSVALVEPFHGFTFVGDVRVFINANRDLVAFPDATATSLGAAVEVPTIGTPRLIGARGNVLFHATDEGFFGARVVSNINAPGAVRGDDTCGFPEGLTFGDNGRAYVKGSGCLSIFDVTQPADPAHVVDVALDGFGTGAVSVDGDLIGYLQDGTARFLRDGT